MKTDPIYDARIKDSFFSASAIGRLRAIPAMATLILGIAIMIGAWSSADAVPTDKAVHLMQESAPEALLITVVSVDSSSIALPYRYPHPRHISRLAHTFRRHRSTFARSKLR